MMYYYGHMGYFGWIWMVVFWGAVIWLILWLVNRSNSKISDEKETPMEILKERYARGEITKKEYEQMKKDIL